jgi:DNA-binding transcriptional MocR family regulator
MAEHYRITGRTANEIAASVERLVATGDIPSGGRLPTVRELASRVAVAPATVAAAYRDLARRGITEGAGRLGTRVRDAAPLPLVPQAPIPAGVVDLVDGGPDPGLLPPLAPVLRRVTPRRSGYGDGPVLPALGDVAHRAFAGDGIPVTRVAVVSGALDGVERVLRAHLRTGDRVAVEDPGFASVHDLVAALGLRRTPIAVDDDGPRPDTLERTLRDGARAVVVTPRAQNPTGAAIGDERARELRRVLRAHPDVLVIEDDHAGPIAGAPVHTLVEAKRARWAVVRSVAKSLGPDLRVAMLTADETTIDRVEGAQRVGPGWVSWLLHQVVAEQLRDRATQRRLARAATEYARRRDALVDALARHGVAAHARSGLNVWVPVAAEAAVVSALLVAGWGVSAGERFRIASPPAIRVNVARLAPADARTLADDLGRTVKASPHTRATAR